MSLLEMLLNGRETLLLPHHRFHTKGKRYDGRMYFLLAAFLCFFVYMLYVLLKFFGSPELTQTGSQFSEMPSVAAVDYKLKLDIYMESLCPDTTDFIQQQLWPNWAKVKDLAHTRIFPYGKVDEKSFQTNQGASDFEFHCQHGSKECLMNQMMTCAMKRLGFRSELYMPFIVCLQQGKPSQLAECVAKTDPVLELADMKNCAEGVEGRRLHAEMGSATRQLSPRLFFVPWTVIEGVRDESALDDLVGALCSKYRGPDKANMCPGSAL